MNTEFHHLLSSQYTHTFKEVLEHTRFLTTMQKHVASILPNKLAPHIQVANIKDQRLTLQVSNSSWATLLRYEIPSLLKKCHGHDELNKIRTIDFFITPHHEQTMVSNASPNPISSKNAQQLRNVAQQVTDPLLKKSLENLSSITK